MSKRALVLIIGIVVLPLIFILIQTGNSNLLIFSVLLLCPLMHFFGHNHSGKHSKNTNPKNQNKGCH